MKVRDDPKLQDDGGHIPNLKEEVGGLIPGCKISSLLDGKLARWLIASYALVLAYQPSVKKRRIHNEDIFPLEKVTCVDKWKRIGN
jgi:hypothetical protein